MACEEGRIFWEMSKGRELQEVQGMVDNLIHLDGKFEHGSELVGER